jgi:hypothetical protein
MGVFKLWWSVWTNGVIALKCSVLKKKISKIDEEYQ